MIPLRPRPPRLCLFYPATLLQGPVIDLYAPTRPLQLFAVRLAHLKVVGGPMLGAAVSGNCPEYLHHPVGLEMHYPSLCGNLHLLDGNVAALIRVHQAVTL